jgi:xylulokinase
MNLSESDADLILCVDVGTSETKTALFGISGLITFTRKEYGLIYPQSGWVEQDPLLLKAAIIDSIQEIVKKNPSLIPKIKGLTFSSQMQNVLPLDKDGKPLYNVMTWLDTRAAELCNKELFNGWPKISEFGMVKLLQFLKITGGAPGRNGKDTICKISWLRENRPEIYEKTFKFVDTKDYAIQIATGTYTTSHDMAYITWLMDIRKGEFKWSDELCIRYKIDKEKLCEIKPSTSMVGTITGEFAEKTGLSRNLPVINGAGDLMSSAIGSGATEPNTQHANVGTAGWVGCHIDHMTKDIPHYIGTVVSGIPDMYLILCKQETLGGALEWMKQIVYGDKKDAYKEIDELVSHAEPGAKKLIFTPWLMGERAPINSAYVRGQFFNLGMYHTRADIFRSIFEGIGYNCRWGIDVMEKLSKSKQNEIRILGGASKSNIWCQIFADIWQKKVKRIKDPQFASASGSAYIAMISLGILKDFKQIKDLVKIDAEFNPDSKKAEIYDQLFKQYINIYPNNKKIFKSLNYDQ